MVKKDAKGIIKVVRKVLIVLGAVILCAVIAVTCMAKPWVPQYAKDASRLIRVIDSPNKQNSIEVYLYEPALSGDVLICVNKDNKTGKRKEIYNWYKENAADVKWIDDNIVYINGFAVNITTDRINWKRNDYYKTEGRILWLLWRDFGIKTDDYSVVEFENYGRNNYYMKISNLSEVKYESDCVNKGAIPKTLKELIEKQINKCNGESGFLNDEYTWYGLYSDWFGHVMDTEKISELFDNSQDGDEIEELHEYTYIQCSKETGMIDIWIH